MITEHFTVHDVAQAVSKGIIPDKDTPPPQDLAVKLTEIYGITSFLFTIYLDRFLANRQTYPPLGLVDAEGRHIRALHPIHPFHTMKLGTYVSFMQDVENGVMLPTSEREAKAQMRLVKLVASTEIYKQYDEKTVPNFFIRGIGTAVEYMSGLLESIPILSGDTPPYLKRQIERYQQIAKNSEPVLVRIASLPLSIFGRFDDASHEPVIDGVFRPHTFSLRDEPIPHITLNETMEPLIKNHISPRRCPATNRVQGGTSGLHRLWSWYINLAERAYTAQIPTTTIDLVNTPNPIT